MKILLLTLNILSAAFFISLPGCKKDIDETKPGEVKSYYDYSYTKVDGEFLVQSNINNNPSLKKTATIGGGFYDENMKAIDGGAVSINDYQMQPNIYHNYFISTALSTDSLYGVNLTFNLTPPANQNTRPVTATFYSPSALFITNNSPVPAIIYQPQNSSLKITWNADAKNTNGVNIAAKFLPQRSINDSLFKAGFIKEIDNSIMVDDNGSIDLPANFFSKFPIGANVQLFVGRGNYTIAESNNHRYKLSEFSNAMETVVVTK